MITTFASAYTRSLLLRYYIRDSGESPWDSSIIIIILNNNLKKIIINRFVKRHKVVTSDALR